MFKRYWWIFLVMLPIGALAGCAIAFLVNEMLPRVYESQTVIEVQPRVMSVSSDKSIEDQSALIMSPAILELAAKNLQLAERWSLGENDTLSILTKSVNIERIRDTDLWCIRVRHADKVAARNIADGLAEAYNQHRNETQQKRSESVLREINKAVHKQEDIVEELRKRLLAASLMPPEEGKSEDTMSSLLDVAKSKSEFVAAQEVLLEMRKKQIGETIHLKIPQESVVIHDVAVISDRPVAPNVILNLVLGTAAGFLLSPLLAVSTIWFLGRFIPAKK